MPSELVEYQEYVKFQNGIVDNQVNRIFEKLKARLFPISEIGDIKLTIEPDDSSVRRMFVKIVSGSDEQKKRFEETGPHYLYIKAS